MLRDRLTGTAIKLGIDDQLQSIRATLHPVYRQQRSDTQNLRLLLQSTLKVQIEMLTVRTETPGQLVEAFEKNEHWD
jgi:hypothetical protein